MCFLKARQCVIRNQLASNIIFSFIQYRIGIDE
jgi:hypothetical protein